MTVALYYVRTYGRDDALVRMRDGILNLLRAFGVDPRGTSSPYHETLTVFWTELLARFNDAHAETPLAELEEMASERFDKNYPLEFYERERLFGSFARREYLAPPRFPEF